MRVLAPVCVAVLLLAALGFTAAPRLAYSVQGGTILNSHQQGTNAELTVSIASSEQQQAHIYSVDAGCSGLSTVTRVIDEAGTTVWDADVSNRNRFTWPVALTGDHGAAMNVTLPACGTANEGTLIVQADRF